MTRTLLWKISTKENTPGFTLIELLIVIALIGLITLFALPSVTNYFKLSLNSASRELASIAKEAYNSAVMTGQVQRLVYDLKENQYWVEAGPPTILLDTAESKLKEERRKKFAKPTEKPPETGFKLNKAVSRKKISLPRGVIFQDVFTEQSPEPIQEGLAFTHFFPHGVTEQAIIHLKDTSNHEITLVISPLIGRTKLIERYVKGEEAYAQ